MKITRASHGGTGDTPRHPFRSPRRKFLRTAASTLTASAVAALMPHMIHKALATRTHRMTGTIGDVGHIVIFTQENRSFDHYFGMLRGVRGFNDRMAIALPTGDPIWKQPTDTGYILPFHADMSVTHATCARAPSMNYSLRL